MPLSHGPFRHEKAAAQTVKNDYWTFEGLGWPEARRILGANAYFIATERITAFESGRKPAEGTDAARRL